MKLIISIIALLILYNCNNSEPSNSQEEILPNTPETVSKQWQRYLDKNELDKVAALSTISTKEWLTVNKELFLNDPQVYQTEFIKMNCQTEKDKATCYFTIQEEGELIEDYFLLKKVEGQWLVDIEDETNTPELDEQIFREMEKELKLD